MLTTDHIGGYFASSWSYPWPNGKIIGLLTLSQVRPVRIQPMPSKYREFFITAPKLSLATEYPLVNGQKLLAVNVHLLAFERWNTTGFGSQIADLEKLMEQHAGPIILVGDFNTCSHERLALVKKAAERLGLTEVTEFSPGRRTGDKDSTFLNWLFGIDATLPLDRVYYRGFLHHFAEVLPYSSSDHRALKVSFDVVLPAPEPGD